MVFLWGLYGTYYGLHIYLAWATDQQLLHLRMSIYRIEFDLFMVVFMGEY